MNRLHWCVGVDVSEKLVTSIMIRQKIFAYGSYIFEEINLQFFLRF
jgi:hypothetical protein